MLGWMGERKLLNELQTHLDWTFKDLTLTLHSKLDMVQILKILQYCRLKCLSNLLNAEMLVLSVSMHKSEFCTFFAKN